MWAVGVVGAVAGCWSPERGCGWVVEGLSEGGMPGPGWCDCGRVVWLQDSGMGVFRSVNLTHLVCKAKHS